MQSCKSKHAICMPPTMQLQASMQSCNYFQPCKHASPDMPCHACHATMQALPCNHTSQTCNHATPSIHATMQVQACRAMQPCKSKHAMQSCKSNMQPCNHATPSIHATMQVQACHAMQPCKSKHACHACHAIMQSKHARHAIIKSMHGMHENPSMPHACKTMHAALAPFSMPCARNKNISNLQEKTVCYPEPFPADTKRDS